MIWLIFMSDQDRMKKKIHCSIERFSILYRYRERERKNPRLLIFFLNITAVLWDDNPLRVWFLLFVNSKQSQIWKENGLQNISSFAYSFVGFRKWSSIFYINYLFILFLFKYFLVYNLFYLNNFWFITFFI